MQVTFELNTLQEYALLQLVSAINKQNSASKNFANASEQPSNAAQEEPILEEPILENPVLENPVLENPVLEEPTSDEPVLENPTQEMPSEVPPETPTEQPEVPSEGPTEEQKLEELASNYLKARINDVLQDYCRKYARISGAAFIDRFTAEEWATLKAARATNPSLAAAAKPLLEGQRVELAGPLAQNGVALLVSLGLLTAERAQEMLAPPTADEVV